MTSILVTPTPAATWLLIWMVNNIGVTLLNKAAFAKVDFHYPWFLSMIHMICNYAGSQYIFWTIRRSQRKLKQIKLDPSSQQQNDVEKQSQQEQQPITQQQQQQQQQQQIWVIRLLGNIQRRELDKKGKYVMFMFSILFTLNIAIGNISLKWVSVNFNQVMRSLVPAVTIVLGILMGKTFSTRRKLAVLPIIIGVAMACFGDMEYTAVGFIVTCFCVLLAALKAVVAGEMLTGELKLHPVDLLDHMSLLAMVQCFIGAVIQGEVSGIMKRWDTEFDPIHVNYYPLLVVWMSGLASFTLNISSLQANKLTSPLTLCIAANVKQVLMIWLGTVIFETHITPLNGAGIVVVLLGSARYSYVSIMEKPSSTTPTTPTTSSEDTKASRTSKIQLPKRGPGTLDPDKDSDRESEPGDDEDDDDSTYGNIVENGTNHDMKPLLKK